jgi:hypothetical protein
MVMAWAFSGLKPTIRAPTPPFVVGLSYAEHLHLQLEGEAAVGFVLDRRGGRPGLAK